MLEVFANLVAVVRAGLGNLSTAWASYRWRRGLLRGLRDPQRYPERVRELKELLVFHHLDQPTGWLWRIQALAEKAVDRLPADDPLRPDLTKIFHGALWEVQNRARSW